MYFTAPSSARQGDRVLITVNGLPTGTEGVKFIASGNSGIDIVTASGGSANFMISLDLPGTTTIEAIAQDKYGATLASVSHSISVTDKSIQTAGTSPPQRRFGMGGSLSGIYEAVIGTMTDVYAQAGGETEQVQFSASNAEMGWMMPVQISPGGSTSAPVRLTSEGTATIFAKFFDKAGNVLGEASHVIRVMADPAKRTVNSPRMGMGGSLSGISEAVIGTMTDIYAQGHGEAEQIEFSASNAEMGWMMPVQISPGGSTSASVRLNSEGTATIYAKFMDKLGNVLGQASHAIRVVADPAKKPASTDLAGMMNSRAEEILKRLGNKS